MPRASVTTPPQTCRTVREPKCSSETIRSNSSSAVRSSRALLRARTSPQGVAGRCDRTGHNVDVAFALVRSQSEWYNLPSFAPIQGREAHTIDHHCATFVPTHCRSECTCHTPSRLCSHAGQRSNAHVLSISGTLLPSVRCCCNRSVFGPGRSRNRPVYGRCDNGG
jgi:hypothetical protein